MSLLLLNCYRNMVLVDNLKVFSIEKQAVGKLSGLLCPDFFFFL